MLINREFFMLPATFIPHSIKSILLVLSLSLISGTGFSQNLPNIEKIISAVNQRDEGQAVSRDLTMTMVDRSGKTRVRETRAFRKYFANEKRTAIFYKKPNNIKDTAFLTYDYASNEVDDDQWLYLPAMRRVRRISAADRGDYFLGTDFTYEDIRLETRISEQDYTHTLLGVEVMANKEYYIVESTPVSPDIAAELGYGKLQSLIDKSNWMITQSQYWDVKGNLLKTIQFSDIRQIQSIWTAHIIKVVNHKTEHKTKFTFSDVDYLTEVPDETFTTQTLRRGL